MKHSYRQLELWGVLKQEVDMSLSIFQKDMKLVALAEYRKLNQWTNGGMMNNEGEGDEDELVSI